jgi:alpha-galactosidase
LPSLSSALLRFTPVASGRPLLVGSNLHLSIGATEIGDIRATADGLEILLTDAGAPDGSLTFHSKEALAADGAENCAVAAVEYLGDNLWRVDIKDRRLAAPQLIRLRFAPAAAVPAARGGG